MAKTGIVAVVAVIDTDAVAEYAARQAPAAARLRLLSGLSAVAFLAVVALPVTIDTSSMTPAFGSALADNGNGNGDGQGKGQGNGKGRGDENGIGKGSTGDDEDDGAGDDEDDPTTGDGTGELGGSSDGNNGDFGDIGDAEMGDELAGTAGLPDETIANAAAPALPTIREIFALGEESVLNAEQELLAIKNGWNLQN